MPAAVHDIADEVAFDGMGDATVGYNTACFEDGAVTLKQLRARVVP
jgi:hypothetical protein